ncbi:SunI/YnzG family protein [Bacillus cereus group sp. MYBK234-1]|uniref:SunI/YnzG family protein n=1 Tax=unclassified Bacillus cereus group TaxID=2750818 RepID=UPI003F79C509
MKEIKIIKSLEKITITWQSATISIPLKDIIEITTTCKNTNKAVEIGNKFKYSETIFIRTKKLDYILFTTNKLTLLNKIKS